MPTSTKSGQTEEQIAEQEFREGRELEAHRRSRNPTERADGSTSEDMEHVGAEGAPNRTTFYADDSPDPKRWRRLWKFNCGVDSHNGGRTRSRFKVDPKARDRVRFVEPLADRLELGESATERAKNLARRPTPKALNFIGGLSTWLLSIALHAANEFGDVLRIDRGALSEITEEFGVDHEQIADGMNKLR